MAADRNARHPKERDRSVRKHPVATVRVGVVAVLDPLSAFLGSRSCKPAIAALAEFHLAGKHHRHVSAWNSRARGFCNCGNLHRAVFFLGIKHSPCYFPPLTGTASRADGILRFDVFLQLAHPVDGGIGPDRTVRRLPSESYRRPNRQGPRGLRMQIVLLERVEKLGQMDEDRFDILDNARRDDVACFSIISV